MDGIECEICNKIFAKREDYEEHIDSCEAKDAACNGLKSDEKLKTAAEIADGKTLKEINAERFAMSKIRKEIGKLAGLLEAEPALSAQLLEALETERWFITVHFQKKYKPDDEHDLHHHYTIKGYPKQDAAASLKNIASQFNSIEFPQAELPDENGLY